MKPIKLLKAGCRYVFDKNYRFLINAGKGKYDTLDDEEYIKRKFQAAMGYRLDLLNPTTFNEKLQWLKLYDRSEKYVTMVDKVAVKQYVAETVGEEYVIPSLGVWSSADEVDFDALPQRFVLKCNHNSGLGMCICKDKSRLDIPKVKKRLADGLRQDYYITGREWPYKNVAPKILAEMYLENGDAGLTDYKIHCFNGVPRFVLVCGDRFTESGLTEDFYTTSWERLSLKRPNVPNAKASAPKPEKLREMLQLAEKLSAGIPFVRVDFYFVAGKIYFSELTFFPASGFSHFEPREWDKTFGAWLELPKK